MKNPATLALKQTDGSLRNVMIEPILQHDLTNTGDYKIYKTSVDNQSALFTEELEINEHNPALPDNHNPDYLGTITFEQGHNDWKYTGELLTPDEQQQAAAYLKQKST